MKKKKMAMGGSSIDEDVRKRALASVANLDTPDDSPAGKSSYGEENDMSEMSTPAKKSAPSFSDKAKKSGFTGSETKGGAAIMYRNQKRSAPAKTAPKKAVKYSVDNEDTTNIAAKKGGLMNSSASRRADGCAVRGKTKGRMV